LERLCPRIGDGVMAVRDVVQAAAGVGGGGEYIEDVFSTYLYTGTGAARTITNGIDLAGEGGMVWIKCRGSAFDNEIMDTARGITKDLITNGNFGEFTNSYVTSVNSSGFSVSSSATVNQNTNTYASWTFRKAPKFFDVVTYTGNGTSGRQIAHSLESVPGMIIVKRTDATRNWCVYHRSLGNTNQIILNSTAALESTALWNSTNPTSTNFTVNNDLDVNGSGATYVAYLFAHDAGGFGEEEDQNIISCGSYTGNGSATGPVVNLGWEPQWLLIKSTGVKDWVIYDTMRGLPLPSSNDEQLFANTADSTQFANRIRLTATGFEIASSNADSNSSGVNYIYIAIRRPMKTPESGTEVFAIDNMTNASTAPPGLISGFPVDFAIEYQNVASGSSANTRTTTRLLGETHLQISSTDAEVANTDHKTDYQNGFYDYTNTISNFYAHMFRRAPGFMDVVGYAGTGVTRTVAHNLGVAPEMIIVKTRSTAENWIVYHSALTATSYRYLNSSSSSGTTIIAWNNTEPTATDFTVGVWNNVNGSGVTNIAYLFATLDGVSKVGSYTGTGADLNVDCGFATGARFILIRRTDADGDWYVWDSLRGITAGNDPYLLLNSTAAQVTSTDYIDPLASGFTVTSSAPAALNASGGSYIFLAIS
jgi:hypothetical protein